MSYEEKSYNLNTSVIDTFTFCTSKYEALLPYLRKKETNFKVSHKLLQVNILLKKLNEELGELIVEYLTDSSCEQKREPVLCEEDRQRTGSDVSEVGINMPKSIKIEVMDTEETRHPQVQKPDLDCVNNIKLEVEDSNEVVDSPEFTIGNIDIPAAQTSNDIPNNAVTVHFPGDDVSEVGILETKRIKVEVTDTEETSNNAMTVRFPGDDVSEVGILETKRIKVEVTDTEETSNTQVQKPDMHCANNIKLEIQDSNEVVDLLKFTNGNRNIPTSQISGDTINNGVTVQFAGKEERASFADGVVGGNVHDKPSETVTQIENKIFVPLQNVKYESVNQKKCGGSVSILSNEKGILTGLDELNQFKLYGLVRHKKKSFKCTFCKCVLSKNSDVRLHLRGKKHNKKLTYAIMNNRACSPATCPFAETTPSNCCETISPVFVNSPVAGSIADTIPSNMLVDRSRLPSNSCESTEYNSTFSDASCSLSDSVTIVADSCQLVLMKHAVRLDDIWTYFCAPFHLNKKFLRFHLGRIICFLCYEEVERNILNVRRHICKVSHLDRMKILRNTELENKSSNQQMLDIPGSLKDIVPTTQFSLRENGFFCRVCNCFCENKAVLYHMTDVSHGKKLNAMKK